MCYICGDLTLNNPRHIEKVIHHLHDTELDHTLAKIKGQIRTLEKFPLTHSNEEKDLTPRAIQELRRIALALIGEKLSRFKMKR